MKAMNLKDEIKSKYGEAAGGLFQAGPAAVALLPAAGEMRSLHRRM